MLYSFDAGFVRLTMKRTRVTVPDTGRIEARFAAIDFETADYEPDSACSVAVVRVEGGRIVAREHRLIRPPRRSFVFTYLHGLAWEDVVREPPFGEVWPELKKSLVGVDFLAAHNARFDRAVLLACCASAGLKPPALPFLCTVQLARRAWSIYPTKLPDVCRSLGITLKHHRAESDAEACARIVLAAGREPGIGGRALGARRVKSTRRA